jgi:hypothetical protein
MLIFRSFLQENEKNYRESLIGVKLISDSLIVAKTYTVHFFRSQ